nr:hypothetical protein D3W47_06800 [Deinococcus sp. RM]
MADGGWRMADGGWRMADGGWRMVNSVCATPPTTSSPPLPTLSDAHADCCRMQSCHPTTSRRISRGSRCGSWRRTGRRSRASALRCRPRWRASTAWTCAPS